jgi:Ran GTPase-activating protein (RanGAP) involved in mRNA processing and transport
LELSLRRGIDLDKILKSHKRGKYGKGKKTEKEHMTPFAQDLSSTQDITTVKGSAFGEVGALSLASELSRGMCPMLETLDLRGCSIRSEGAGKLFVGIKMANLVTLRVLNLRGNFLGAYTLAYLKQTCQSGVFMNLQILVLSDNELGDDGITAFLEIVMEGHFLNMFEIHMQNNGITDYGFNKLITKLASVKEVKCPNICRMNVSNNPISAEMKRKHHPLPAYFSV